LALVNNFPDPNIIVRVDDGTVSPMVGSVYSLTCTIAGTERLMITGSNVTYQWFKDGAMLPGQAMDPETLSFSSLTISDAGSYSCVIVLSSYLLSGPISRNSEPFNLILSRELSYVIGYDMKLWLLSQCVLP
jgi:hypothetical protein